MQQNNTEIIDYKMLLHLHWHVATEAWVGEQRSCILDLKLCVKLHTRATLC